MKEQEQGTEQEIYLNTVLSSFKSETNESDILYQENHEQLEEWYYNNK